MIDARLADGQTDGWRYAGMPADGHAWRDTLASGKCAFSLTGGSS